jgi:hypothetical protein
MEGELVGLGEAAPEQDAFSQPGAASLAQAA